MAKIKSITAHKMLNSRSDWTISTRVILDDGSIGVEFVPDGASKGINESIYLPADQAVEKVNTVVLARLKGLDASDQKNIDNILCEMDGTENDRVLGGNSILSISLAVAKASAQSAQNPLYKYLAELFGNKESLRLPTPVFNILNGGKHAQNDLSFQEFMVIPSPNFSYPQALEVGVNIYKGLKKELHDNGYSTGVGDEGGFAPTGFNPKTALNMIKNVAKKDYHPGEDVFFGMDIAAESFWNGKEYEIKEESLKLDAESLMNYYADLLKEYELIYMEDPYFEQDRSGWYEFHQRYGKKLMVVADDLVVTNPKFLKTAIEEKLANAVIVKPNQVGTLTETLEFIKMAKKAGMSIVVSHRSGDTAEDTFISDLAAAVGAEFIKSGAPARGERVAKYNRLLEIYYEIENRI